MLFHLLALLLYCIQPSFSQIETYCTRDQFNCGQRKCIEKILVCDGIKHCQNGADELSCTFECDPQSMYQCRSSTKCIKNKYVCDTSPDCPEKDDEESCDIKDCAPNKFQCHYYKSQCIDITKKCDGIEDCGDKTDEAFEICNPNANEGVWSNCKPDEFRCKQGLCIPKKLRCDFRKDCPDASDEIKCPKKNLTCSKETDFQCLNPKQCIDKSKKCDDIDDCNDGSDEDNCVTDIPGQCDKDEFDCRGQFKECISKNWVCDGSGDCFNNKDEENCARKCTTYEFYCQSENSCLSNSILCNGKIDCSDGSDEQNCKEKDGAGTRDTKCHPYEEFDCFKDGSKCINMSLVCNKQNDCTKEGVSRDETPGDSYKNCKFNHCSLNNGGCAHFCHNLFYDKVCTCKEGFKLQSDNLHCTDLNECSERLGACSQICRNLMGTFECDCRQGYTRKFSDPTRCESTGDKYLLFSSLNTIRELRMNHGKLSVVAEKPRDTLIVALDYDIHSIPPRIFWSEMEAKMAGSRVMMMHYGGEPTLLLDKAGIIESMAFDWINGLLYLVDSQLMRITALNITSLHHTVIIDKDLTNPRGIVIEPTNTMIYWTDWGKKAKIESAGMDGQMRETLVEESIVMPNGLAFDYELNTLYWGDAKLGTINSVDLASNNRHTIFQDRAIHPFSMDVFEDVIYWSDWNRKTIMSINKFTGENLSPIAGTETPFGIHLQHKLKQPKRLSECQDHKCSQICLPTSRLSQSSESYSCACDMRFSLSNDSVTCLKNLEKLSSLSPSTQSESNFSLTRAVKDELSSTKSEAEKSEGKYPPDIQVGTIAAIVCFVIFMIFLVGLLLGFLLRRNYINQTTQRPRDLDELTFLQDESKFPLHTEFNVEENEILMRERKI